MVQEAVFVQNDILVLFTDLLLSITCMCNNSLDEVIITCQSCYSFVHFSSFVNL